MGEPFGKREIFRKYPDVVDVPQLCEMLGGSRPVSKKTAYRMLNAGKIKAFRIGRSYRIPKVNVIRFLQNETPEDCNTVNPGPGGLIPCQGIIPIVRYILAEVLVRFTLPVENLDNLHSPVSKTNSPVFMVRLTFLIPPPLDSSP